MNLRLLLMALLAPAALHAQLALFAVNGTSETLIVSAYNFGSVAIGDTKTSIIRARNIGNDLIVVSKIALSGMNFTIVNTSSPPVTVAPGLTLDIRVAFAASTIPNQTFTANLQVNAAIIQLTATTAAAASLTVAAPCIGPDSQGTISFGRVQQGGQVVCTISLQNATTQDLTVSPITVTGLQFSATSSPSVTILAGQTVSFPIKFTAAAAATFTGTLTSGPRSYALSGTGFSAPLSAPVFSFDAATFTSGQQYSLTITLPQASPVSASGTLTLTFTPSGVAVTDDTAVQFVATGKRVASFTVTQGTTAVRLNNQPSAVFSSGTTAGTITFSMDAGAFGITGPSTTSITLAPIPIAVTAASATSRANDLDITITGFDNTYSVGRMSFTFYDRSGVVIGSALPADFSAAFRSFFQGQTTGSTFLMRVSFPVTGYAQAVGGVDVTLNNIAGSARTSRLGFP